MRRRALLGSLCFLAACAHGGTSQPSEGGRAPAAGASAGAAPDAEEPNAEPEGADGAGALLPNIVVDGHVDLPYRLTEDGPVSDEALKAVAYGTAPGDFDFERAMKGGLNAPFMSLYVSAEHQASGDAKEKADALLDLVERLAELAPDRFAIARSPDEVREVVASGRIALPLGIENGAAVGLDLDHVNHFFERGVRYITLTHSRDNEICDSSYDDQHTWGGLSPYGHQVVERMNEVGIMVDVSHVSDQAFWDVMKVSSAPVIASHSSARHFTPGFERNLSDDMIRAIAEDGGVVMVNFGSTFVSQRSRDYFNRRREAREGFLSERSIDRDHPDAKAFLDAWEDANPMMLATVADVADHIDHIVKLVGIDHVGLGSDFDGVGPTLPQGLRGAEDLPNLFQELKSRGYGPAELDQLAFENIFRVWTAVQALASY